MGGWNIVGIELFCDFYEEVSAVAVAEDLLAAPEQPGADQNGVERAQTGFQADPASGTLLPGRPQLQHCQVEQPAESARPVLHHHFARTPAAQPASLSQRRDRAVKQGNSEAAERDETVRFELAAGGPLELQTEAADAAQ